MIFDKKKNHKLQNVKQLIFDIRIKETLIFGEPCVFGVQTYLIFLILYVVLNTLIKLRRGGNILIDWLSKL
jgi:hypothetical protein